MSLDDVYASAWQALLDRERGVKPVMPKQRAPRAEKPKKPKPPAKVNMGNSKPVTINGITYPSRARAGEALGVPAATISSKAIRGVLEKVGVDQRRKPVVLDGVSYETQAEAAKALGFTNQVMSSRIKGIIRKTRPCRIPVTIRGVEYPSMEAAARSVGVCAPTIRTARLKGTLDKVGLPTGNPCIIGGVKYRTQKAAAAALGVSKRTIGRMLKR